MGCVATASVPIGINFTLVSLYTFYTDIESIRSLTPISVGKEAEDSESDMDNNSIKSSFFDVSTHSTSKKRMLELEVVPNVPKLIDNKRKRLEKRLSAAQRDQKLIEVAKKMQPCEDTCLECFKHSSTTTTGAMENMSATLKEMSQDMTQAMVLLANAFNRPQQPAHHHPGFMPYHFNQPIYFGSGLIQPVSYPDDHLLY
ncbi:Hypothetical predicted protein [Paramuricea clavata]|uniref:Uncharacterized protein n=1 Tax=Paramuricea clavata TaxID=317549 RepID=A0A6S7JLI9_PARCT|nr:Hypothetical predicted protein [Paramuricea clavata]